METECGEIYNPGRNVLGLLRKLGTKTHFAELIIFYLLKKLGDVVIRGYFCYYLKTPSIGKRVLNVTKLREKLCISSLGIAILKKVTRCYLATVIYSEIEGA